MKRKSNSLFYVDRITNGFSNLYVLDGWDWGGTKIIRYDDVGNINYGATGRHIHENFEANKKVHFEDLMKAGGHFQQAEDAFWNGHPVDFLKNFNLLLKDKNTLFYIENTCSPYDEETLGAKAYIDKLNDEFIKIRKDRRSEFGDDARDTYAIGWGFSKYR